MAKILTSKSGQIRAILFRLDLQSPQDSSVIAHGSHPKRKNIGCGLRDRVWRSQDVLFWIKIGHSVSSSRLLGCQPWFILISSRLVKVKIYFVYVFDVFNGKLCQCFSQPLTIKMRARGNHNNVDM